MRVLVISDLHGDLDSAWEAIDRFAPDALLCCGDWGDPEEVNESDLAAFPARLPVLTTFGNHDPLALLPRLQNRDGTPILLGQGETRTFAGLRVAAIGGIWAKSHRQPHYVTDDDVAAAAAKIEKPLDVLMTHGCPVGLADMTPKGNHGGQRCFLDAFHNVAPRVHLCGHLHVAQERALKDGRHVLNVGATPEGSIVLLEAQGSELTARLDQFPRRGTPGADHRS